MPIPSPKKNEKQDDFISRCIASLQGEFEDNKQRAAVCYEKWRNKQKHDKALGFDVKIKESKLISRNSKKSGKSEKRIVVGYAATYDVFTNGDTLQISRQAIEEAKDDLLKYSTVLFNHDPDRPIGNIIETATDDKGLLVKFILSNSEDEIWAKVQDGTISKLSFQAEVPMDGYEIIESKDKLIFQVKKIRFFEAGLVSIPGNGEAETLTSYVETSLKEYKENKVKLSEEERCEYSIISDLEKIKEKATDDETKLILESVIYKLETSKQVLADLQILSGKLAEEDRTLVEAAIILLKEMSRKEKKLEPVEEVYDMADESDGRPVFQLNSTTDGEVEFEDGSSTRFKKQVLKFGKWFHWNAPGGVLNINESVVDNIVKNFKKKVIENVYVPLTHTDDPSKNTGNVVELIKTDKGLDAVIEIKDESIAEKIKKGLIKCVSASLDPNYRVKKTNEFVGPALLHTALVAEPYIKGMGSFVPLSDVQFSDRPVVMLEDEEPNIFNILKSINDRLTKIEDSYAVNNKPAAEDVENKKMEPKEEIKKEEKVEETKPEENVKAGEEKKVTEEETEVVEDKEEVIDIEAAKKAKDEYGKCIAETMKDGTSMAEASKKCKSKIKESFGIEFSDSEIEVKSTEEPEIIKEQEVDLADVEKKYDEYLKAGKIVPAQKEVFIKLFSSVKKVELSDNKVGVTELIDSFMKLQPKIVNFDESGAAPAPQPPVVEPQPAAETMPDDVKSFYGKMGLSEDMMKKSWEYAKEMKAEEERNKESSIF